MDDQISSELNGMNGNQLKSRSQLSLEQSISFFPGRVGRAQLEVWRAWFLVGSEPSAGTGLWARVPNGVKVLQACNDKSANTMLI